MSADMLVERIEAVLKGTTPGPWEVPDEDSEDGPIPGQAICGPEFLQPGYEHSGPVSETVAVVGFSAHDHHAANKRLIAAAPTLLREAADTITRLRTALEKVEWATSPSDSYAVCPWCGWARDDGRHASDCLRQQALGLAGEEPTR